jgi:hypothetical protein
MMTAIPAPEFGLDKFAMIAELDKRNIDSRPFFSQLCHYLHAEQYSQNDHARRPRQPLLPIFASRGDPRSWARGSVERREGRVPERLSP